VSIAESTVLTISEFQPREVSFESIGRTRDVGVVEVTKHEWERVHEHAAGALEVVGDPGPLCELTELRSVTIIPSGEYPLELSALEL
jgi:hypothetical protein